MLTKEHEVHALVLAGGPEEARLATELPAASVTVVRNRKPLAVARAALAFVGSRSLQSAYADSAKLKRLYVGAVSRLQPDLVYLNVWRTAHLAGVVTAARTVIDLDEFRSEYYAQLRDSGRGALRLLGAIESPRMGRGEIGLLKRVDRALVSSPADLRDGYSNVSLIRSPVAVPAELPPLASGSQSILFVGRLTYEANLAGLRWFLDNCWEGVKAKTSRAKLVIAGAEPPRWIRDIRDDRVEVVADFEDAERVYSEAALAIVPIARGTGVQMKLIQALANGVPTVTFPQVSYRAGIDPSLDVVASANEPDDWTSEIVDLLGSEDRRSRLSHSGWEWAQRNHSRESVEARLKAAMAAATSGHV